MYSVLTNEEVIRLFSLFNASEENFVQKVVKAIPDVMYVMNLNTTAVLYSSRLVALEIGYSAHEVEAMGNPVIDIMHPDDKSGFLTHLEEVKAAADQQVLSIEYRLIRRDGKIAWYVDRNTVFTRNTNGIPDTKIGITHEITQRKEYEERLLRNEKIIQQTEELAGTGSWEYDLVSKVFRCSPGMYKLFNLPNNYQIQPDIYLKYAVAGDLPIARKIVQSIHMGQNGFEETLHIAVNGALKSIKIKAEPVQRTNTKYDKIIGTDLDTTVSEKKQSELETLNDELQRRNREVISLNADLKTFSQVTTTEYKSNFKNIYTSFEMIVVQDAARLSNSSKALVRKIQSSIQRMNLLTGDIESYLNISLQETSTEQVDLDQIFSTVIADFKNRISQSDITINKSTIGTVVGIPNLITILFTRLLDNAIKFRRNDTNLVINIYSVVNNSAAARNLTFSVEDNGIGIDPSEKDRLFDLFYKNHHNMKLKGSGVGLAVAKKIMELHNGFIDIKPNASKQGTIIECYFPIYK